MSKHLKYTLSPGDRHKVYGSSTLPKEFLTYLRTLFELLDKENQGYIQISDLEEFWGNEYQLDKNTSNSIIIKRLHEISPGNSGLLSYPRLCTGIREALLQVKVIKQRPKSFIQALNLDEDDDVDDFDDTNETSPQSPPPPYEGTRKKEFGTMSARVVEGEESSTSPRLSTGDSIGHGIQMLDKIKWWYSKIRSQYFYNFEINDLSQAERGRIERSNAQLEDVLKIQSSMDYKSYDEHRQLKDTVKEQQDRILQLEAEKSLLIRELFQMKAQLKSPVSKKNFPLFN